MNHTFLYDGKKPKPASVAVAYSPFGQLADYVGVMTGMGGIYSTVDDLLRWDQALYTEKLVHQSMLKEAFTPYPVKEGTSTYGFGWNSLTEEGSQFVWHTGNTGSFKAFLGRHLAEKITVIILTNKGNGKRMEINNTIPSFRENPMRIPACRLPRNYMAKLVKPGLNRRLHFTIH